MDRLVAEHARGGRALLAGEVEGGVDERGHDLVEVGVGVDDDRVLAAHLGHHALEVALAVGHLGGGADDLEPDLVRAGEGDRVHARVLDQRGADVALARQQRQRLGRHARLAQRLHEDRRAAGRLLGRLEQHRVAGREAGGDHPERDRDGEVPGRDHRDDAARASSAARCARPAPAAAARPGQGRGRRARSTRGSRSPRTRRRRPRATAWPPRGPRARRSRAAARAATPPRRRGSRRAARASSRPTCAPRCPAASASAASTSSGRRGGGLGHHAAGRAGVGRDQVVALAALVADPDRHPDRRPRVVGRERAGELRADRRPPQLEDRLVGELVHARAGGASSCSSGTPLAWSLRNESLLVFSSSRRTR